MVYAIISVRNGNYFIEAEGIKTIEAAKTQYHGKCQAFWSAPDVISCEIAIVDEQLDVVEGYKEFISHEPTVQPEPEPEEE